jgi:uncharacterized protein (TIGR00369 family)
MSTEIDPSLTAFAHQSMPFTRVLGLEVLSSAPSRVEARAAWQADRCTGGGILHGGYLMSLADSVGAMCASQNLPEGAGTATIESKTNLFRPVAEGTIAITATPIHVGRTTIVVQTDITLPNGKLVSRTIQTQAVLTR